MDSSSFICSLEIVRLSLFILYFLAFPAVLLPVYSVKDLRNSPLILQISGPSFLNTHLSSACPHKLYVSWHPWNPKCVSSMWWHQTVLFRALFPALQPENCLQGRESHKIYLIWYLLSEIIALTCLSSHVQNLLFPIFCLAFPYFLYIFWLFTEGQEVCFLLPGRESHFQFSSS